LEEPEETGAYQRILASLAEMALTEAQSREYIGNLAVELYSDREDRHDHG
jgi:hypothetical protein